MARVWVVIQHRDGKVHRMSREAIAAGQSLASALGGTVEAVVMGSGIDSVAEELCGYELASVFVADAEPLADYTPGGYAGVLRAAVSEHAPTHLVFAHSYQNIEYMARLALDVGGSLLPEVVAFAPGEDGDIVWERPVMGGKLQSKVRLTGPSPALVSVQSGAYSASAAERGTASRADLDAGKAAVDREILGVEEVAGEQVDLSAAEIVVAAGRGVGGEDKMGVIEDLAAALGAEIGASRPVIDSGWLPRDRQIGSSGQTVAPKLYVAAGVSGAIQHLVGMKGAGTTVAINKDGGAPIFSVADYGIVGDLHEVLPVLAQAIREAKEDAN